jgi:ankyrin repeat protein
MSKSVMIFFQFLKVNMTQICRAACRGDLREIKSFLEGGNSSDTRDPIEQRTLLHFAATNGKIDVMTHLLAYRADINATDAQGETPLHQATRMAQLAAVELLVRKNANTTCENNGGDCPLALAQKCQDSDLKNRMIHLIVEGVPSQSRQFSAKAGSSIEAVFGGGVARTQSTGPVQYNNARASCGGSVYVEV